jgi:monoamine oxidase
VGSGDRRAILEAFVEGPEAVELAEQSDDEILESALADIEKVHPAIRDYAEGGVVKAWSADPYTMGGWSWAGPGDVTGYLEELQRPSGRIHFAGEHTSILRATMEGALRSGERTAREVDVAAMAED